MKIQPAIETELVQIPPKIDGNLQARICRISECVQTIRTDGLCQPHFQEHLKEIALDARSTIPRSGPCLVYGCDRPRRSRGLCGSHYDRGRRRSQCPGCWGDMQARSGVCGDCSRAARAAHLPTEKTCRQCERVLSVDAFGLRKSGAGSVKWRSRCRECEAANQRLRPNGAHRDRSREHLSAPFLNLRGYAKKLEIPWAEVVDRYPADNRCEVCGRTPQEANPGGRFYRLSLDHCHQTGKLRGFLCSPCNTGLGHLGDTLQAIRAALDYLARSET